jgi:hypothetical protein
LSIDKKKETGRGRTLPLLCVNREVNREVLSQNWVFTLIGWSKSEAFFLSRQFSCGFVHHGGHGGCGAYSLMSHHPPIKKVEWCSLSLSLSLSPKHNEHYLHRIPLHGSWGRETLFLNTMSNWAPRVPLACVLQVKVEGDVVDLNE